MKWISSLFRWLEGIFGSKTYTVQFEDELPNVLKEKVLYVMGERTNPWYAAMLCPCGCRESIHLSLLPDDKPSWKFSQDLKGKASLKPSVWRTKGCKSHFFFRDNQIDWCK